jgi:hypothetical protein
LRDSTISATAAAFSGRAMGLLPGWETVAQGSVQDERPERRLRAWAIRKDLALSPALAVHLAAEPSVVSQGDPTTGGLWFRRRY